MLDSQTHGFFCLQNGSRVLPLVLGTPAEYPKFIASQSAGFDLAPHHAFVWMKPKVQGVSELRGDGTLDPNLIDRVTAVAVKLTNQDATGEPVDVPLSPDDLYEVLPFTAAAWEAPDSTRAEPQYLVVFPYRVATSPDVHAQVAARLASMLPAGAVVLPPETWVPTPSRASEELGADGLHYPRRLPGQPLAHEQVLGGEPPRVLDPEDWTPYYALNVLAALMRSPTIRWLRAHPEKMTDAYLTAVASNFAALIRAFHQSVPSAASTEAMDHVARRCFAAFQEIPKCRPDFDAGLIERTYTVPCLKMSRPAATFSEFVELGFPRELAPERVVVPVEDDDDDEAESGGLRVLVVDTMTPLELAMNVVRQFQDQDPAQWVFNGPANRYTKLSDEGELRPETYAEAAFRNIVRTNDNASRRRAFEQGVIRIARHEYLVGSRERLIKRGNEWVLNSYYASTLQPLHDPDKWARVKQLFDNLTGGDPAGTEHFLDWLAAQVQAVRVQRTHRKLLTAMVLHGEQGAGKGTLEKLLGRVLGESNIFTAGQDALEGRYNAFLEARLLVIANEVSSAARDEHKLSAKIKALVTDPTFPCEDKFVSMHAAPNTFNLIFSSNDKRPVRVESGDRRFTVFHSGKLKLDLGAVINGDVEGHAAALLHELLTRTVTRNVDRPYENAARGRVAEASLSAVQKFVQALLAEGYENLRGTVRPSGNTSLIIAGDGCSYVTFAALVEVFRAWAKEEGAPEPRSINTDLGDALRDGLGLNDDAKGRVLGSDGKKKISIWRGIPLDVDETGKAIWTSGEIDPSAPTRPRSRSDGPSFD